MLSRILILLIFFFIATNVNGFTGDSTRFLLPKDTIFLEINQYRSPIFTHYLMKGQTLFSLAKFYGLKVYELYYYNTYLVDYIPQPGDAIKIPINQNRLIKGAQPQNAVPVFYKVKSKETFYTIAKNYFNIGLDTLKSMNHKKDLALVLDEKLLLGYIPINGLDRIEPTIKGSPLLQMSFSYKKQYLAMKNNLVEEREQGRGAKLINDNTQGLYVLHQSAPVNSIIGIYNPIKKRIIYAQVLGRIPNTITYYNSILVINKNVAKLLGVIDERFFIKVKYLKNKEIK